MVSTRGSGTTQSSNKLHFKDKLTGSSDALQKKLKTLFDELVQLEQGHVDVASLNVVKKDLISPSMMLHKDKGVKAYAACCMADLLRLYAPDAPYTASELRDMFQFFFRQLSTSLKLDSPYYHQHFLLLESLSTVKSIVLVCDLPNADELISVLFRELFILVKSGDLGRNVELHMTDILSAVIDECHSVPNDAMSTIIAQFLPNAPSASHRLAAQVCNHTSDKLQRHVCQYFTDIMLSTAVANVDENDDDEAGPIDSTAVRTAHSLIISMSVSAPAVLHNVIPQLEAELRAEDLSIRCLATETLGSIFSNPKSGPDFVKKYLSCWKAWLQRKADKHPSVRIAWVECVKDFIGGPHELMDDIEEGISQKIMDPDEKVRAAACKMYGTLSYEVLANHAGEKQLRAIGERVMDKKYIVRLESITTLGRLWNLAWPDIERADNLAVHRFSWIPSTIFHAISHSIEAKQVAEEVIATYIFPLPAKDKADDDVAWTERLLTTWKYLDDRAIINLLSMTPLKTAHPSIYEHYLQACVDNNGGIVDSNEETIKRRLSVSIHRLCALYVEPQKAGEDLYAFAKLNDQRLFKLLRTCMDPTVDVKHLAKATSEFLKRIEQNHSSLLNTLSVALRRTSFWIINPSTVRVLLRLLQTHTLSGAAIPDENLVIASRIVKYISKYCPIMHEAHVAEFSKLLSEQSVRQDGADTLSVEICLGALAGLARKNDDGGLYDRGELRRTISSAESRAQRLAKEYVTSDDAREAKFAARILVYSKDRLAICPEIVNSISEGLSKLNNDMQIESRLTVLAEFVRVIPDIFETKSDVFMAFLLQDVLLKKCVIEDETDAERDWLDEEDAPPLLRAKVQSLKICRNRCIAQSTSPTALDVASPVLKMLFNLLDHSGSFSEDVDEVPGVTSRLRLYVASCLLHLSSVEAYRNAISPHFVDLALVVQDSCFNVRFGFLQKLISRLQNQKLDPSFNVILFLTVLDPERETREKARNYVTFAVKRYSQEFRIANFEMIFIRFLHLLAHHPDFEHDDVIGLQEISKYLNFYLDLIATADNLPLLYHLAMKAKTVRDAESHTFSENLYILSEMAQQMIKARAKVHSWSLPSYPGKVKLPPDLFKALPSHEAAAKILKTTYMPEELSTWLAQEGGKALKSPIAKNRTKGTKDESAPDNEASSSARKRKPRSANDKSDGKPKRGRPPKKRRLSRQSETEDDVSEDEESNSDDDDMGNGIKSSPTPRRVKEETPPTELDVSENEEVDEQAGVARRTRAKTRRRSRTNGRQSK